jgi:hypothetical protein
MLCVLDHLAPGLPVGPQALLIRYGRHAHDAGCGIYPGLVLLKQELRASTDTLRKWRDELQDRRLIERLPRVGPRGADLLRLGRCDYCRQRTAMQVRCPACQRTGLLHAETEWWAAQRTCMAVQKVLEVQVEPAATPDLLDGQAAPGAHRQPADNPDPEPGTTRRVAEAASLPQPYLRDASNPTPAPRLPGTSPAPRLPRRVRANHDAADQEYATSARW